MLILAIVGAIVLGVVGVIFLIVRARNNYKEYLDSIAPIPCKYCKKDLVPYFARRGLRGTLFRCACGKSSWLKV
jgi:hypothetical protein